PRSRIIIRGFAFAAAGLSGTMSINGGLVSNLRDLGLSSEPNDLSLSFEARAGERDINMHIHFDNLRSPSELGLSSDTRKLGLFVQSIRIETVAPYPLARKMQYYA